MNIHEYQAKELLRRYDVPVPKGVLAESAAEAKTVAAELGCERWAVKAQVHAGGRGKAGGVKLVDSLEKVASTAGTLLGRPLVTEQTGPEGKVVRKVYIEPALDFERGLYLGLLVDRASGRPAFLGAREGGEDIETRAVEQPDVVRRLIVDPEAGLDQAAVADFVAGLGLDGKLGAQATKLVAGLYKAFWELDASLIEINPLAVMKDDSLLALDLKISLDDNALYRHDDLEALRDQDEVDPSELEAKRYELNFVKLQGDIGVVVNGAGLALATIDMMKDNGLEPADFMDMRPVATREQIATGCALLFANPKIKAILVNIYGGGILRCDTIAEGIALTCKRKGLTVPLVVRAAGTNHELARKIILDQGIKATFVDSMSEAIDTLRKMLEQEAA